jgi:hypothetical protein
MKRGFPVGGQDGKKGVLFIPGVSVI